MRRLILGLLIVIAIAPTVCAQQLDLEDLRVRTLWKLGKDTIAVSSGYTDAQINTWVNDAITYISRATLCYERDTTYAIDTGVVSYTMPVDFIRVSGVKFDHVGGTTEIAEAPYGVTGSATSDLGKKAGYEWEESGERSRALTLTPIPELTGGEMTVTYFAYAPWLLADDSVCYLPYAYQLSIPDYAASQAWDSKREVDPYWPKFESRMNLLIQTNARFTEPESARTTTEANP